MDVQRADRIFELPHGTAETCVQLIERNKIADALGLCRSLLENYLLFILICRGRKFFRLQDCTKLTDGQFKKRLTEEQAKLKAEQEAGTAKRLAVEKCVPSAT